MPVHFVGISGGRIWHTIRNTGMGWEPWDDIMLSAGPLTGPPSRVACGLVRGALHVCVTTSPMGLYHTIRFGRGSWQPWGDAAAAGFPGVLGIINVDCVGLAGELHVCVDGFRRTPPIQTLPAVWHSIRRSNSWTAPREVTGRYRILWDHACGGVDGDLHVLARCQDVPGSELLMHTIRFADGTLQPVGDQDVIRLFPAATAAALRRTGVVAAAGIGGQLHVVASDGSELFHTIRLNNTSWQPTFGPVRVAVDPTFTAGLTLPACASADNNLHVFAISSGAVWHTIRLSAPPSWRNPETAGTGMFGDVLAAVPPSPAGVRPPRAFDEIAAAGG